MIPCWFVLLVIFFFGSTGGLSQDPVDDDDSAVFARDNSRKTTTTSPNSDRSSSSTSPQLLQLQPDPWMECVDNIHAYFKPENKTHWHWKADNPCGFKKLSWDSIRREAIFSTGRERNTAEVSSDAEKQQTQEVGGTTRTERGEDNNNKIMTTFSFSGDSTGIRCFIYAWNELLPPNPKIPFQKVAKAPGFMQSPPASASKFLEEQSRSSSEVAETRGNHEAAAAAAASGGGGGGGGGGNEPQDTSAVGTSGSSVNSDARFRYYRLMFLSTGPETFKEAIKNSYGKGFLVLILGNWDLNWQIQLNQPMPGLVGGTHNYNAAKDYWIKYVNESLTSISEALLSMPEENRPFVIIREQMLPNCHSSRFSDRKRSYRKCAPFVRPSVVPLYRRILSSMAWSLGIPTIPMDQLFEDSDSYCALGDGLHLDIECHRYEQELIWNTYLLMRRTWLKNNKKQLGGSGGGGEAATEDDTVAEPLTQGVWQKGIAGRVAPLIPMQDTRATPSTGQGERLSQFPLSEFLEPEAFSHWRAKFSREAPSGYDIDTDLYQKGREWSLKVQERRKNTVAPKPYEGPTKRISGSPKKGGGERKMRDDVSGKADSIMTTNKPAPPAGLGDGTQTFSYPSAAQSSDGGDSASSGKAGNSTLERLAVFLAGSPEVLLFGCLFLIVAVAGWIFRMFSKIGN